MSLHILGKLLCLLKSGDLNESSFLDFLLWLLWLLVNNEVRLPLPISQHLFDEVGCKLWFARLG